MKTHDSLSPRSCGDRVKFLGFSRFALLLLWLTLGITCAGSQTPELVLRFGFDEASGTTTSSDAAVGTAAPAILQMLDGFGELSDARGLPGSGLANRREGNRALNLTSSVSLGTNGPVAAGTNVCLGLGELRAFTATLWFRIHSHVSGKTGPRLFLIGASETATDTGATNSIGLKFQNPGCLHFQVNQVTCEADFIWSLPTNTWLFVAVVSDGEKLLIYRGSERMPAELVAAKAAPGLNVAFGKQAALFIGNRRDRARPFRGAIDDFRFYAGAASPAFVEGIRHSGCGNPTAVVAGSESKRSRSAAKWVAVTTPAFASALAPLVRYRRSEGFRVTVIKTTDVLNADQIRSGNGAPLRERLRDILDEGTGPKYLLLAGVGTSPDAAAQQEAIVPPLIGTTARMKDQPTDFGYALPNPEGLPTVAVGRFPARTLDELKGMVAKTLHLERHPLPGPWRNRILLVQGNPGGGPLAEMFLDGITRPRLTGIHPVWQFQAISHNPASSFYLPTPWLQSRTIEWLSAGQLFAVYLGHSGPGGLTSLNTRFLSTENWSSLDMQTGPGVFFSCGCFGCQWDRGPDQAYGLAAIRNPQGPTAVIGAHGESYSAPGLLAVDGLLRGCSAPPFPARLADYWLSVQKGLAEGEIGADTFNLLDIGDGTGGKEPLEVQRREHLEMWTLLGDPALRLPIIPLTIELKATTSGASAKRIKVEGNLPRRFAGRKVQIFLERTPRTPPADLKPIPRKSQQAAEERDQAAAENHLKQNSRALSTATVTAKGTRFTCSIEVPDGLKLSTVVLRALAEAGNQAAQGVLAWPLPQTSELEAVSRP